MLCNVRVNRKAPGTVRKSDVSTLLTGVGERNPQLNPSYWHHWRIGSRKLLQNDELSGICGFDFIRPR